jgi:uncharacterized membrane protein
MSNRFRVLFLPLAAALAVALAPAPAPAAVRGPDARPQTSQARLGGFRFGRRAPVYRSRYRSRGLFRPGYRRSPLHGFFRGVLRLVGIAYLMHLMFGWGGGGSPFGLLLLGALVLWLFTRRRRRVYW